MKGTLGDARTAAERRTTLAGAALAALSATCFGSMVLFGRWAYEDGVSPTSLLFLRFAFAAPILGVLAWMRAARWPRRGDLGRCVLMGLVFVGNSLAYFVALAHAPAATVATLFFLYPAIVVLGCRWLFGEQLSWRKLLAVALACGGATSTMAPAGLELTGGTGLALTAAAIYACYVLLARMQGEPQDPLAQTAIISAVCAVLFGALAAREGWSWPASALGWGAAVALALVSTVIALSAFLGAVARIGPSRAAVISAAEPAVAALAAVFLLGELLRPGMAIGLVLIGAAAVLVVGAGERSPKACSNESR